MKKIWGIIAMATMAISSMTAKELPEVKVVIPLTDLTADKTEELFDGNCSDVAILCAAGTELPLKFLGSYGLFSVKFAPNLTITVDKTFYVRYAHHRVYVSYDLIHWDKDFFKGKKLDGSAGISPSGILIETHLTDQEE